MKRFEYGEAVAIALDHLITFGIVDKIITTTDNGGERTVFAVRYPNADGETKVTELDSGLISEIERSTGYTEFDKLVRESPNYKWAIEEEERLKNPPSTKEPAKPDPAPRGCGLEIQTPLRKSFFEHRPPADACPAEVKEF